MGSPGTGKTLFARAVAGEANVRFSRSAGPISSRCSSASAPAACDLFEQGKKNAPCIVFIDEITLSASPSRSGGGWARADAEPVARRDGRLRVERGVILVAATNRPVLDRLLVRALIAASSSTGRTQGTRNIPRSHAQDSMSDDVDCRRPHVERQGSLARIWRTR